MRMRGRGERGYRRQQWRQEKEHVIPDIVYQVGARVKQEVGWRRWERGGGVKGRAEAQSS